MMSQYHPRDGRLAATSNSIHRAIASSLFFFFFLSFFPLANFGSVDRLIVAREAAVPNKFILAQEPLGVAGYRL